MLMLMLQVPGLLEQKGTRGPFLVLPPIGTAQWVSSWALPWNHLGTLK